MEEEALLNRQRNVAVGDGGAAVAPQPQPVNPDELQRQNRDAQAQAAQSWDEMASRSPVVFYIFLLFSLAEAIATSVILGRHWNTPCDRMLRIFILVYTCRLALTVPITVYRFRNRAEAQATMASTFLKCTYCAVRHSGIGR